MMDIKSLDLHGVRHEDVGRQVDLFINANWGSNKTLKIITGNSAKMKAVVTQALAPYGLKSVDTDPFGHTVPYLLTEEV